VGDQREDYAAFLRDAEPRLRNALVAGHGAERGMEALSDTLLYGYRHWERIAGMQNPIGYLYRVGQRLARRRPPSRPIPVVTNPGRTEPPWVEPALSSALAALSRRQREVVVLVEAFDLTHREAADVLGIRPSSVQTHLERGLSRLRTALGVDDE
jgi:DNA-directed RNA polymerase specialized sigma24 family protein